MSQTPEQFAAFKAKGNARRIPRATFRREVRAMSLRDGLARIADELDGGVPAWLETAPVSEVISWPKRSQASRRARVLKACEASEFKTCGELTYRQRVLLVNALRGEDG